MKLTIGIPFFNSEEYIGRCLESIVELEGIIDYEILCLDDGSTDDSCSIISKYAERYKRIRLIKTENAGAFLARSRIIDEAQGDWIGFVDADDTVDKNMYRRMLFEAEQHEHVDMVVCAFNKIDSQSGKIEAVQMNSYGNRVLDFIRNPDDRGLLVAVNPAYWNKIYRREKILDRLILNYSPKIMEDYLFFASIISNLDGVAFVEEALYNYFDIDKSVTKNIGRKEYDDAKKGLKQLNNYLLKKRDFQTDIYKKDLIAVMSCAHLGIAFSINMNIVTKDVLKEVYYDSLLFLNVLFPNWWNSEYLRLDYLKGKPQLIKMYIACKCYKSKMWLIAVNVYHAICKITNYDMKW